MRSTSTTPRPRPTRNTVDNLLARAATGRALVIAAVFALAVGGIVSTQRRQRAVLARWGPTVTVVVAARPLPAGHRIGPADTRRESWPRSLAPPDALRRPTPGRTTATELAEGEPLRSGRLLPGGGRFPLVPPGQVAVSVATGPAVVHAGPGDRVMLILGGSPPPAPVPGLVVGANEDTVTVAVPADAVDRVGQASLSGSIGAVFAQPG